MLESKIQNKYEIYILETLHSFYKWKSLKRFSILRILKKLGTVDSHMSLLIPRVDQTRKICNNVLVNISGKEIIAPP